MNTKLKAVIKTLKSFESIYAGDDSTFIEYYIALKGYAESNLKKAGSGGWRQVYHIPGSYVLKLGRLDVIDSGDYDKTISITLDNMDMENFTCNKYEYDLSLKYKESPHIVPILEDHGLGYVWIIQEEVMLIENAADFLANNPDTELPLEILAAINKHAYMIPALLSDKSRTSIGDFDDGFLDLSIVKLMIKMEEESGFDSCDCGYGNLGIHPKTRMPVILDLGCCN